MAKKKASAQSTVRTIRRKTRKKYSAEDTVDYIHYILKQFAQKHGL
jgi:hypothetical protein